MKIDEPKTPYVTDEEFKKLCEEDPDYQKQILGNLDINSQEANADGSSDHQIDADMILAQTNTMINMNIKGGANSDDELSPSKEGDIDMKDSNYFNNNLNQTNIKQQPIVQAPIIDFGALTGKLDQINDEEEEARKKKEEFEKKRKMHYANEFNMAQALKNK